MALVGVMHEGELSVSFEPQAEVKLSCSQFKIIFLLVIDMRNFTKLKTKIMLRVFDQLEDFDFIDDIRV